MYALWGQGHGGMDSLNVCGMVHSFSCVSGIHAFCARALCTLDSLSRLCLSLLIYHPFIPSLLLFGTSVPPHLSSHSLPLSLLSSLYFSDKVLLPLFTFMDLVLPALPFPFLPFLCFCACVGSHMHLYDISLCMPFAFALYFAALCSFLTCLPLPTHLCTALHAHTLCPLPPPPHAYLPPYTFYPCP